MASAPALDLATLFEVICMWVAICPFFELTQTKIVQQSVYTNFFGI